jgi:hypothetical protein
MARRLLYVVALLPLTFVLASYARSDHFFANQYDDSYITYRYAINLAQGHGLVFNVGERTDAASSLLYTLLLALSWLSGGHNLEWVAAALGCLSLLAICVNVHWLAHALTEDPWVAALCALCCGLNGFLSGWTLSGMETLPWSALVLLALTLMVAEASELLIALAVAAAVLTRFEGLLLVAAQGTRLLLRREKARGYLPGAAVLLLFATVYLIKYAYYGVWISHAFKMKEVASYYGSDPRELYTLWRLFAWLPLLLGLYGMLRKQQAPILVYVALSAGSLLLGPRSDWCRYSVHLLPVFYAFAAVALHQLRNTHRYLGHAALLVVSGLMLRQALRGHDYNMRNMLNLAQHQKCRRGVALYLRDNISSRQYIASADLGIIAYVARQHRFVDLVALTSADVLEAYQRGQTADQLLIDKHVAYLADTFTSDPEQRLTFLLGQFPGIRARSRFTVLPDALFSCAVRDGALRFELRRIALRPP